MKVGILFSGGKDSCLAIETARNKGWEIAYLLSVKPTRRDCYLFHYATVELTKELANILGIPHIYTTCSEADVKKEAQIVYDIVKKNPVDAILLGGIGLQETQIKAIRDILFPLGVEVFATHTGLNHEDILRDMVMRGYEILITEVAADGLDKEWLGKKIDIRTLPDLKKASEKFGFHIGFEGGHANTLVLGGPIFNKSIKVLENEKIMDGEFSGFLKINKYIVMEKYVGTVVRAQ